MAFINRIIHSMYRICVSGVNAPGGHTDACDAICISENYEETFSSISPMIQLVYSCISKINTLIPNIQLTFL